MKIEDNYLKGCGGSVWGCGGSVVERQAANPLVPGSNPRQSLQYQKNFLGTVKWQVKIVQWLHMS